MATANANLRIASVAVSSALLGLASLTAVSMTIPMQWEDPFDRPTPIVTAETAPPAESPRSVPIRTPRPAVLDDLPLVPNTMIGAPELPAAETAGAFDVGAPPTIVVTHPSWVRRPSNLARYYPRRALLWGVEGQVILNCSVSAQGALSCAVESETPPNWGFGEAAQRIARDHQMIPAQLDGVAVEARYRMLVPFNLD